MRVRQQAGRPKGTEMINCVEDDEAVGNLEAYALENGGFQVRTFENGKAFFAALETEIPELILLDIMLPGEDGLSILKKLRNASRTAAVPVIMTTAKGTEFDKVSGLDMGADDYLVKPFGMMELVSRVRAVLRRTAPKSDSEILRAGSIVLDPPAHTASADGRQLELTRKEFALLELLMKNPGRVFDRETLLLKVWDSDYAGDTRTVDVHVGTLRAKLGEAGSLIQTVRGIGYKLEDV